MDTRTDVDRYLRMARAKMRRHGIFVQGVSPADAFDLPYTYTVGLQRRAAPHPEVIVFPCCISCGHRMLERVHRLVRAGGELPLGVSGEELGLGLGKPVRVEEVRREWIEAHAAGVFTILRREPGEVRMRQLVLPDERGRWPEEQGDEVSPLGLQPLLSRAHPWLRPVAHDDEVDLFADPDEPHGPLLAVPVLTPHGYDGRHELLRVEPLDDHRAIVDTVPWVADHVAVGAVVEVLPLGDVPGCERAIGRMGAMLSGGFATRAYRLPTQGSTDLGDVLWRWHASDHTAVSTTSTTLHVNTAVPAAFDGAMRPFLRDGVLVPRPLQSVAEPFGPPIAECPDCG